MNITGLAGVEYEFESLKTKAQFIRKIYPYDFDENNIFVFFV